MLVDPQRLQQILSNVIANAIKFTPEGGRVSITAGAAGDHLEVVVRDSGIGISAEFLPYVFDRFRQADASASRRQGGLGLGLALVRQLVELHGGAVAVESPGRDAGTTVTVRLPLHQISPTVTPSGNGS